jgi:hypoxanthine phosphoribosyltransferase
MGIAYNENLDVFEFNFTSNSEECIVEFVDLPLEPVLLDDVEGMSNVYYFGYEFLNNDHASSKIRTKFLHELRFNDNFTTQKNKELFIKTALSKLKKSLNITINDIGIIIYPKSRSSLNEYILRLFYALTNSKAKSFEVIKELPQNIQFKSPEMQQHLNEIQTIEDKILMLDDVSTTGATLKEIIKIIRFFNKKTDIILFTLIGKKSII